MVTLSRANIFPFTSLPSITAAADHHHHPHRSFVLSLNKPSPTAYPSFSLRCTPAPSSSLISCNYYWHGGGIRVIFFGAKGTNPNPTSLPSRSRPSISISAQMSTGIGIGKAQRWWEKGIQPSMKEVTGAQDLVDSLLNAGDKLVVVDFFSPGCGGCKALHPKICQLAEMHADVVFLQVNYETHKSMCYALNVHVLPFFRFYRGAHGRLCSFSCTNATIKKFKDALAKYGADFCSLEPTKGLEEKELLALAANRNLSFDYTPKPTPPVVVSERDKILLDAEHPLVHINPLPSTRVSHSEPNPEKRTLISSAR